MSRFFLNVEVKCSTKNAESYHVIGRPNVEILLSAETEYSAKITA